MGREIRKVPANWQHPKNKEGRYIPLFENNGRFERDDQAWLEGWEKWQQGLCEQYGEGEKWGPVDQEYIGMRYTDYAGSRPSPDDYMPDWEDSICTHFMMYETCSEGTPISPVFNTPEEVARWCADNGASAFGSLTASYEEWLRVARGGFACSAVYTGGAGLQSGVSAMYELDSTGGNENG